MALLPSALDYTDKDFDALRARLIELVRSAFPEWSDFSVATFGNVLLEMFAFVGDVLTFYQDAQARESRLATATQRRNVIALAKMLGYRLRGATAATAELEFRLARASAAPITIPAGTRIRTQDVTDPVRFQLLAPVVIPAFTEEPVRGVGEHSRTHVQLTDARGRQTGEVRLAFGPYLDGSAEASTAQGAFVEVENFLSSRATDRHFVVSVDESDRATLRFGDGQNGLPPTGTIRITYKTGGGRGGNVDASTLSVLEGAFTDANGRPVQLSVTNPRPASGGDDRQSIASARLLAPESLRALTRSVAREDFEIHARRVPGVARALMLTRNEDPSIDENAGVLFVVPEGGGAPTPALKSRVLRQVTVDYPCTLTFQVSVQDPVYRRIDVAARVFVREGASGSRVGARIRENLAAYFRIREPDGTPNPRIDFGFNLKNAEGEPAGELAWSDVVNVIRDTDGVRKLGTDRLDLLLNGLPTDVKLDVREFPVLGTVTLRSGDTGELLG